VARQIAVGWLGRFKALLLCTLLNGFKDCVFGTCSFECDSLQTAQLMCPAWCMCMVHGAGLANFNFNFNMVSARPLVRAAPPGLPGGHRGVSILLLKVLCFACFFKCLPHTQGGGLAPVLGVAVGRRRAICSSALTFQPPTTTLCLPVPVPLCVVPNMDCAFRSLRETPVAKHALRIYAEHRFPKGLDRTTVVKRNPNRERMLHGCAKTALYVAICVYVGGAVLAVLRAVVGW
jgi:hypothetical protein